MSEDKTAYKQEEVYRTLYREYERSVAYMLACAGDPDCTGETYQLASARTKELFSQLAAMRKRLRNAHGRSGNLTTERERPRYPEM